ncbi:hypothetical protein BGZ59_005155 [Podila verticillata]|nr:hypothetical protein BGZ59_005155 [Podila verticillata]
MVKLSLSFLPVAAAFTVASAAPFLDQQSAIENFDLRNFETNECISEALIKEYHPFQLWSGHLSSIVSRQLDDNVLVAGINGDKTLQQLEFCVVTDDKECSTEVSSSCISGNTPYRFRVNGPLQGYLHIEGPFLRIVNEFEAASSLEFQKNEPYGLRVVHVNSGGVSKALTVFQAGHPLVLDYPKSGTRQLFELLPPNNIKRVNAPVSNKCVPEVGIKEYQPFQLLSFSLDSFVSKQPNDDILVGGIYGNKNFQELEFCVVTTDDECTSEIEADCIYEDKEYFFRVTGPAQGYLRIQGDTIRIIENFGEASQLSLYRAAGWGLRITHEDYSGRRLVFSTTEPGEKIRLEEPQPISRQSFRLEALDAVNEKDVLGGIACVPGTSIREYHPFMLKSSNLDSYVSKMRFDNILVGGIRGNKAFQELVLCIVSGELGCNAKTKSNCIYENVEYKFRVNSPIQGYLRIVDNQIDIIEDFDIASSLTLTMYQEAGWGLRIAHVKKNGSRIVFSATEQGEPIELEAPVANAKRQWFQITGWN